MKRISIWTILCLLILLLLPETSDAIGRRRWRQYSTYNYSYGGNYYGSYLSPQEAASAKAQIQASRNSMFHPGGGFGGGSAEGVGAGATPGQALGNCCFSGQRPLLAEAVVQGSNGWWYACRIFR